MKKEETVVGVLLRFLEGEEARKASLISKKVEGGGVVLSSYSVPIAELREGEVVIKYSEQAYRKHRKWLVIIAQEKGIAVTSESQKGE